MNNNPRLDIIGAALSDPTRAQMLCTLMDGRAFTNKELSSAANVTAQTASSHLKRLQDAGLTTSLKSGRHVYHQIKDAQVAGMLEQMAVLSPRDHLQRSPARQLPDQDTRRARSCYNHIAGRLGVLMTQAMIERDVLVPVGERFQMGPNANQFFADLGLDLAKVPKAKPCLDWTERKYHLAGPLGSALMTLFLDNGWLERQRDCRALLITPAGFAVLEKSFGLSSGVLDLQAL